MTQAITNQQIAISPDALFRELDGEAVLLDLQSERYYGLDRIGARIWQLIDEHGDVATVKELMLQEYDVDEERLTRDLDQLITQLVDLGLMQLDEAA
jgi:hypothetical protein